MKIVNRFCLTSFVVLSLAGRALAQTTPDAATNPAATNYPAVTFGVVSFLQYAAELHEQDGYNAFDVTRGYLNIQARLSDRIKVRFTPDVRPTTDASLDRNLALRLEYASLDVQVNDSVAVMFGLHEMPWLTYEESVNRYRVLGPFFSERLGLLPGATDLGASIKASTDTIDVHVGVYNGEGYGRAEIDKFKSIDGRATFRPFGEDSQLSKVSISGFYQYRLVRGRPPAQRGHRHGQLRGREGRRHGAVSDRHGQPVRRRRHSAPRLVIPRRSAAGSHRLGRCRRSRSSSIRTRRTTATRDAARCSAAHAGVRWVARAWAS